MGSQQINKVSTAFLVWKRNTGIPIDYAYDNQVRGQGLLAVDRILRKHMKVSMLTSFTKVQLHALDRLQKAKNVSEMLKHNTNFVR